MPLGQCLRRYSTTGRAVKTFLNGHRAARVNREKWLANWQSSLLHVLFAILRVDCPKTWQNTKVAWLCVLIQLSNKSIEIM